MLSFDVSNDTLAIRLNSKNIYLVKKGQTLLSVGTGKSEYKMSHGSFKICEKMLSKKALCVTDFETFDNKAVITLEEGVCTAEIVSENKLFFSFSGLDKYNRMWFDLPAEREEYVYGCGENFSEFNLRGKKVNVWVAEHINALQIAKKLVKQLFGIKNTQKKQKFSNYETYYAQPTFVSSRKYFR